jgi:hypothetical protein
LQIVFTLVRHRPLACPISKPWAIHNIKSRFHFLNHHNHPHLGMPFLKRIVISWVIFATFSCNCVSMSLDAQSTEFFSHIPLVQLFLIFVTHLFPFFSWLCLISYTQLRSDVIGAPHLWAIIYNLLPTSMFSIANFRETLSQFPFFLMFLFCRKCDCMVGLPLFPSTMFVHP